MNKRGNAYLGVALGIAIWIFGILMMPYLTDDIDTFRSGMDCSNTSISDGARVTCLYGDVIVPYFLWTLAVIVIGLLLGGFK